MLLLGTVQASAQNADLPKPLDPKNLQTAYCPQTHRLEAEPSQKWYLDGAIGKRHVRMYLDRGGSGVVGLFFDIGGHWETTLLGGTWTDGQIDATDAREDRPATGHLKASLANNRLIGTWTVSTTNQSEPVQLITIPEPRCDAGGPWRHFHDPDWPVAFSYPASWHLEQADDDSIVLTCPNPSEIAFDQHISVHHGAGAPDGPTKLVQCGNSWRYGFQCRCGGQDSDRCPTAKISHMKSATVLDVSEQEHRIYCLNDGYVAAGDGEDRVVLLQDQWLEINGPVDSLELINRMIASVTLRKQKGR
jgi:hypothetical protein